MILGILFVLNCLFFHNFSLMLSLASQLLKEQYCRYLGEIFVQFFLSWIYLKFKSLIWTVKSEWRFSTYFERILFSCEISLDLYIWHGDVSAEIKSYIRKSICEKYRDKKHCFSVTENWKIEESCARLFGKPIFLLPLYAICIIECIVYICVCIRALDLLISNLYYRNLIRSIWKLFSCFSFNSVNLLLIVTRFYVNFLFSRKLEK